VGSFQHEFRGLSVRGKSHPWPLPANAGCSESTCATPQKPRLGGPQLPHPAAADSLHSLLAPVDQPLLEEPEETASHVCFAARSSRHFALAIEHTDRGAGRLD
jgi:hypothetical protein